MYQQMWAWTCWLYDLHDSQLTAQHRHLLSYHENVHVNNTFQFTTWYCGGWQQRWHPWEADDNDEESYLYDAVYYEINFSFLGLDGIRKKIAIKNFKKQKSYWNVSRWKEIEIFVKYTSSHFNLYKIIMCYMLFDPPHIRRMY